LYTGALSLADLGANHRAQSCSSGQVSAVAWSAIITGLRYG
jgi:hypothetical protein